ncbi:MAG: hypothetical protein P8Y95_11235 [Gammaproteobacteria bacterium]
MDLKETLTRKLRAVFPDGLERKRVWTILEAYGGEEGEQEPERVRLAILKLSGAEPKRIETYTQLAKQDFRDIIAWAEYPRQSKRWSLPEGPRRRRLVEADRAEYEAWLSEE